MASTPPPPPVSVAAAEVEEILQSPHAASASLIADEQVASGSFRRPSLPSPVHSFRSVTACSPLSSPNENDNDRDDRAAATDRNGRRRMLRSGTSGSITPLSATSPEAEPSRSGSLGSSVTASSSSIPSPTAYKSTDGIEAECSSAQSQLPADAKVTSSENDTRSTSSPQRTESSHLRPTDPLASSSRSDGLLSVATIPAATDLYRTPSQISIASDADGYFTARPGSPAESYDQLSLSLLRAHADRARSSLRRDRVSSSGQSYSTAASDYFDINRNMGNKASRPIIGDEACYVDGEHEIDPLPITSERVDEANGPRRIDFIWDLPAELSICILSMLESHVDLLSVSAVSRQWRAFALHQPLWRRLFFEQPGWAIREDAPLVIRHQVELQRLFNKAQRLAAKEEAKRARRLKKREAASTSSPMLDRFAALKSWKDNLHIPSFPQLARLSLSNTTSARAGVDVDTGRAVAPVMSPLRSPTAATGRFGLFLSPASPAPSTPAGTRRAYEASLHGPHLELYDSGSVPMSRQNSGYAPFRRPQPVSEDFARVIEAEEFFAESLSWSRLYRDRYLLEQRWLRGHLFQPPPKMPSRAATSTVNTNDGENMARTASTSSEGEVTPQEAAALLRSAIHPGIRFHPTRKWLHGHSDSVYCIRQDDGIGTGTAGKIVSGSRDQTIRIWDVEMGDCRHLLKGHTASVLALQYDDKLLVSGSSDGSVYVWDFASILEASKRDLAGEEDSMSTYENDTGAMVHHISQRVHCVLREHVSAVLDVVFDENWIVTGSKDSNVCVWRRSDIPLREPGSTTSVRAPKAYRTFPHIGPVNAIDLQADQIVSASGEGSLFLWDIHSGERRQTFRGHTKGLACIVFKGTTLISGSNDQTIRVWDTVTGKCTHVLEEHQMLVRTVAYDPVRRLVVSGGYDRLIKIWHLDDALPATDTPQPLPGTENPRPSTDTLQPREEEQIDGERSHDTPAPDSPDTQLEDEDDGHKPLLGRCLREFKIHKARIFDVDFNTTRIVSASEDNLICVLNFGGQGIDTSLFA